MGVVLLQLFWIPAPFKDIGRCIFKKSPFLKLTLYKCRRIDSVSYSNQKWIWHGKYDFDLLDVYLWKLVILLNISRYNSCFSGSGNFSNHCKLSIKSVIYIGSWMFLRWKNLLNVYFFWDIWCNSSMLNKWHNSVAINTICLWTRSEDLLVPINRTIQYI